MTAWRPPSCDVQWDAAQRHVATGRTWDCEVKPLPGPGRRLGRPADRPLPRPLVGANRPKAAGQSRFNSYIHTVVPTAGPRKVESSHQGPGVAI